MAHAEDRWFRAGPDGRKVPAGRHGTGKRWRAVWSGPDGRRHSKALGRRGEAARIAAAMQADADWQRALFGPTATKTATRAR